MLNGRYMKNNLMPLKYAARKYKLPPDWLESEAKSGKLSCLIAGAQIFFNERLLLMELNKKVGKPISEGVKCHG